MKTNRCQTCFHGRCVTLISFPDHRSKHAFRSSVGVFYGGMNIHSHTIHKNGGNYEDKNNVLDIFF